MVGRVDDVELTDRRDGAPAQQRPAQQPAPQRAAAPAPRAASGFEDMSDDIPFADPMASRAFCMAVQ